MITVKNCKKHGLLTKDQCRIEISDGYECYRCIQCKREKDAKWKNAEREKHRATANAKRNIDRTHVNAWSRKDRKENPDKYRQYEKNYIEKHGIEKIRRYEVARRRGLTIEQVNTMVEKQKNLCAICFEGESRIGRTGEITSLCIDCDHETNKVRALLCHNCNLLLANFMTQFNFWSLP